MNIEVTHLVSEEFRLFLFTSILVTNIATPERKQEKVS
jgi:hypothetical protein